MRKGTRVALKANDDRGVLAGTIGTVVAVRHLPTDPTPQALVKWRGKSGHVAHNQSALEELEQ